MVRRPVPGRLRRPPRQRMHLNRRHPRRQQQLHFGRATSLSARRGLYFGAASRPLRARSGQSGRLTEVRAGTRRRGKGRARSFCRRTVPRLRRRFGDGVGPRASVWSRWCRCWWLVAVALSRRRRRLPISRLLGLDGPVFSRFDPISLLFCFVCTFVASGVHISSRSPSLPFRTLHLYRVRPHCGVRLCSLSCSALARPVISSAVSYRHDRASVYSQGAVNPVSVSLLHPAEVRSRSPSHPGVSTPPSLRALFFLLFAVTVRALVVHSSFIGAGAPCGHAPLTAADRYDPRPRFS